MVAASENILNDKGFHGYIDPIIIKNKEFLKCGSNHAFEKIIFDSRCFMAGNQAGLI